MPVQACLKPALASTAVTGVCNIHDTTFLVPSTAKKLRTNMQRPKVLPEVLLLLILYVLMGIVSGQSATELPRFCLLKSPTNYHRKWHNMTRQIGTANPFNAVDVGFRQTGAANPCANPLNGVDVGFNASPYFVDDDNDGGVCPITEAVLFPSEQEFECPTSSLDASRWIVNSTHDSQELARCTLDVTNNGNSPNHGEVHLIDARGIITCPANNASPPVGKELETFVDWQGAYWCFRKEEEKEKRKVSEAAVNVLVLGGINYSEANIICTSNRTRRATCRMNVVAASAVGEKRASYDGAKVVVKKSPFYHNLGESGQILHFEVNSLVVNVSWQQKEVPFLKFSLLESCAHVL
jgi:hypothetical protein